jgi:hypothetical protein
VVNERLLAARNNLGRSPLSAAGGQQMAGRAFRLLGVRCSRLGPSVPRVVGRQPAQSFLSRGARRAALADLVSVWPGSAPFVNDDDAFGGGPPKKELAADRIAMPHRA